VQIFHETKGFLPRDRIARNRTAGRAADGALERLAEDLGLADA
jgi:hypothetical protein